MFRELKLFAIAPSDNSILHPVGAWRGGPYFFNEASEGECLPLREGEGALFNEARGIRGGTFQNFSLEPGHALHMHLST